MGVKDTNWVEQLGNIFPTFTWPLGTSPAETVLGWIDAQQKFFSAATEASRQLMTITHKQIEIGNGIMQRIVAAKSPEEVAAAQRDLMELMGSVYVERMAALGQPFGQLAHPAPAETADTPPPEPPKKKRKTT